MGAPSPRARVLPAEYVHERKSQGFGLLVLINQPRVAEEVKDGLLAGYTQGASAKGRIHGMPGRGVGVKWEGRWWGTAPRFGTHTRLSYVVVAPEGLRKLGPLSNPPYGIYRAPRRRRSYACTFSLSLSLSGESPLPFASSRDIPPSSMPTPPLDDPRFFQGGPTGGGEVSRVDRGPCQIWGTRRRGIFQDEGGETCIRGPVTSVR